MPFNSIASVTICSDFWSPRKGNLSLLLLYLLLFAMKWWDWRPWIISKFPVPHLDAGAWMLAFHQGLCQALASHNHLLCACSLSVMSNSFLTPWTVSHQSPRFMARILEWVAISTSRASSQTRDWTCIFCIAGEFFTGWTISEAQLPRGGGANRIPFRRREGWVQTVGLWRRGLGPSQWPHPAVHEVRLPWSQGWESLSLGRKTSTSGLIIDAEPAKQGW